MLESVSAEAKYCIGRTPAMTRLGYGRPAVGEVCELPEDDDVDGRREDGHEERPGDPEERLLVADDDVAPDERPQKVAVVPELAHVELRPAVAG